MQIHEIDGEFTVCKVKRLSDVDLSVPFIFCAVTDEEISLVCPTKYVPVLTMAREDGWKAFRIQGELDFGLIGILACMAGILAENGIPIYAVSTYNTDYVLVKSHNFHRAFALLQQNGYEIV